MPDDLKGANLRALSDRLMNEAEGAAAQGLVFAKVDRFDVEEAALIIRRLSARHSRSQEQGGPGHG